MYILYIIYTPPYYIIIHKVDNEGGGVPPSDTRHMCYPRPRAECDIPDP